MAMTTEQLSRLAGIAAKRYARACWWADPRDLEQQAVLEGLRALRTFDTRVGTSPEQYVWKAMMVGVKDHFLWRESAVATGGTKHRPGETARGQVRESLFTDGGNKSRGAHSSLGDDAEVKEEVLFAINRDVGPSVAADDLYDDAAWLARVRGRLEALAEEEGGGNTLRVLLGEASAKEVAEVREAPVSRVYGQSSRLRGAVSVDGELYALMRERRGE